MMEVCIQPYTENFLQNMLMKEFYRATRMHSADYAVARCLSVRLSVLLSVRLSVCHTQYSAETAKHIIKLYLTIG